MGNSIKLEQSQKKAEAAVKECNKKIAELGEHTNELFTSLNIIQKAFDNIRNVPSEDKLKYEELKKIRLNWKKQADTIMSEYKKAEVKAAGQGAAGVGAGVAVAAMGPTAAMGIATTFGVASTGTAISTLSGAAATNAALAWLGGGALAAGGGGMAAGNAFLALAGPVGWAIAGVSLFTSALLLFKSKADKERLESIFTLISDRDTKSYQLAIVELSERISRIKSETKLIDAAIREILTFGLNYNEMTEEQQYKLGGYVALMESSTALLVNPIFGLQPKYTEVDFENYKQCIEEEKERCYKKIEEGKILDDSDFEYSLYSDNFLENKELTISLANLLYKIYLSYDDKKLLAKSLSKNKDFMDSVGMENKKITRDTITAVTRALDKIYSNSVTK